MLQHLPPQQRATPILRAVLDFSAREVADVHGSTVSGGLITGITAFRDTERLFPLFDLPDRSDPDPAVA